MICTKRHMARVALDASCITHHTSYFTLHTSRVTLHTPHISRHSPAESHPVKRRVKSTDGDTTDSGSDSPAPASPSVTSPLSSNSRAKTPSSNAAETASDASKSEVEPSKRARWGSGVAAQRAALALSVQVDDNSSTHASSSAAAVGVAVKSKDTLKMHLCQELTKAGFNGMEQTVEKCDNQPSQTLAVLLHHPALPPVYFCDILRRYIEGMSADALSAIISQSALADAATLTKMVSGQSHVYHGCL